MCGGVEIDRCMCGDVEIDAIHILTHTKMIRFEIRFLSSQPHTTEKAIKL